MILKTLNYDLTRADPDAFLAIALNIKKYAFVGKWMWLIFGTHTFAAVCINNR